MCYMLNHSELVVLVVLDLVLVLPWAWALLCSDGDGGAQGTTGCWERTPAPGGGGARPKNHLAKPPIRVLQSTAGCTETQTGRGVEVQSRVEGRRHFL